MKIILTPPLKNFNFSLILGVTMVLLLINSCRKENDSNELDQTKTELQQWYKEKIGKSANSPFSNLQPNWQKVYINKQQKERVYEIELSNPKALVIKFGNADIKTQQEHSNVRLLIFKDDLTGNIKYGAYMYINHENETNPMQLHYKKLTNLTGRVVFYNLNGIMANGWIYKDGKAIAQTTPDESLNLNGKTNSAAKGKVMNGGNTSCGYELMDTFFMVCVTVPALGTSNCNLQYYGKTNVMVCTTDNFGGNQQTIDHIAEEGLGGLVLKLDCKGTPGGDAINVLGCGCVFPEEVETACAPLNPLELKTDSLKAKFPCADKLIAQPILTSAVMKKFVEPFLTSQRPSITYLTDNTLPWGNATTGGEFMLGYNGPDPTSVLGQSSIVRFNEKMLQNSSQLLIAATVVHETLHAYIKYHIATANYNYVNADESNWMVGLNNFYLMGYLPANYSNHTMMLEDYFEKSINVLEAWNAKQGFIYSMKEMRMAMLYGLDRYESGTSQAQINTINTAFQAIKTKHGISTSDLTAFNQAKLISTTNKLPTTGCN